MLIENKIMTLKLTSGEEIVGRYVAGKIERPFQLGMMPGPNGQVGIGFAPFLIGAEDNAVVEIPESAIVARAVANKAIQNEYIRQTTGITPAAGLSGLDLSRFKS